MMINFKVDQEKCTNCGLCSSECPTMIITSKTKFPTIKEGKEKNCLKCQHCLAICPSGAISIWDKNPENSIAVTDKLPISADMERLIKTRRSIRKFTKDEIDKNLIHQLISTASYAPTGQNDNNVRFSIIDNKKQLSKMRSLVYSQIKQAYEKNRLPASKSYFNNFQKMWFDKQIDIIFRNAPHLIITSAPKSNSFPETDSCIAMNYFDLLANCNGIGTLWNGFAMELLKNIIPEVKQQIGIPDNHTIGAVLIFGKPAVKFTRSIQNDNPNIQKINL